MFLRFALKNIWANKKRSIITVILTSVTTALLIFDSAFMTGSHNKMIESAVEIYPGYLQITHRDFRDNPSLDNLIFDTQAIRYVLAGQPDIDVFGERFESYVLFAAGDKAVGGMLTGIEPEREKRLSRLFASLKKGEYLEPGDGPFLYIGSELARRLHVDVGDELAFIGSGADYSFAADNLTVKGIFQTGLFDFDASASFVSKSYFDEVMAADGLATHIVVLPSRPRDVAGLSSRLDSQIGADYQALNWQQTMASLVQAMKVDSIFGYITFGIIFMVILFVVMIYTLLAVYARIREIGILRALGTTPGQILRMLLLESILLSFISVVLGGIIGGILAWYFQVHPIVFSGFDEQFKQYGLAASALPTEFSLPAILRDMAVMFVLAVLSTLYPILKVNHYRPIEAIHHV